MATFPNLFFVPVTFGSTDTPGVVANAASLARTHHTFSFYASKFGFHQIDLNEPEAFSLYREPIGQMIFTSVPALGGGGGVVSATFPMFTADAAAIALALGGVTATMPPLFTAAGSAVAAAQAAGSAVFPMFTGTGTGITFIRAVGNATLPALRATMTVVTGSGGRTFRSFEPCPRPASGWAICGRVGTLRTDGGH